MRALQSLVLLLTATLAWTGCEGIDSISGGADAPAVTYASTTFDAVFYEPGTSATPSIDWNGAQGSISLGSTIQGLSVNSTTGQLQWTKMLPPGTHNVDVVVSNSEGQVVVPVTIENPIVGLFEGTYSGNSYFALDFQEDGTLLVFANSPSDPETATGTYTILPGGEVTADYTYDDTLEEYSLLAEMTQNDSGAFLNGDWYFEFGAEETNIGNTIEVELQ